ncbi:hypothetical protein MHYP_G00359810 [Metynnis hypsauchen]
MFLHQRSEAMKPQSDLTNCYNCFCEGYGTGECGECLGQWSLTLLLEIQDVKKLKTQKAPLMSCDTLRAESSSISVCPHLKRPAGCPPSLRCQGRVQGPGPQCSTGLGSTSGLAQSQRCQPLSISIIAIVAMPTCCLGCVWCI